MSPEIFSLLQNQVGTKNLTLSQNISQQENAGTLPGVLGEFDALIAEYTIPNDTENVQPMTEAQNPPQAITLKTDRGIAGAILGMFTGADSYEPSGKPDTSQVMTSQTSDRRIDTWRSLFAGLKHNAQVRVRQTENAVPLGDFDEGVVACEPDMLEARTLKADIIPNKTMNAVPKDIPTIQPEISQSEAPTIMGHGRESVYAVSDEVEGSTLPRVVADDAGFIPPEGESPKPHAPASVTSDREKMTVILPGHDTTASPLPELPQPPLNAQEHGNLETSAVTPDPEQQPVILSGHDTTASTQPEIPQPPLNVHEQGNVDAPSAVTPDTEQQPVRLPDHDTTASPQPELPQPPLNVHEQGNVDAPSAVTPDPERQPVILPGHDITASPQPELPQPPLNAHEQGNLETPSAVTPDTEQQPARQPGHDTTASPLPELPQQPLNAQKQGNVDVPSAVTPDTEQQPARQPGHDTTASPLPEIPQPPLNVQAPGNLETPSAVTPDPEQQPVILPGNDITASPLPEIPQQPLNAQKQGNVETPSAVTPDPEQQPVILSGHDTTASPLPELSQLQDIPDDSGIEIPNADYHPETEHDAQEIILAMNDEASVIDTHITEEAQPMIAPYIADDDDVHTVLAVNPAPEVPLTDTPEIPASDVKPQLSDGIPVTHTSAQKIRHQLKPAEIPATEPVSSPHEDEIPTVKAVSIEPEIPVTTAETETIPENVMPQTHHEARTANLQPESDTREIPVYDVPDEPSVAREDDSAITDAHTVMAGIVQPHAPQPVQPEALSSATADITPETPETPKAPRIQTRRTQTAQHEFTPKIPDEAPDADTPTARPVTPRNSTAQPGHDEPQQPETTQTSQPAIDIEPSRERVSPSPARPPRTAPRNDTSTEPRNDTRKIEALSDFQSFFDGAMRAKRTSSRINTRPLSLRTDTYEASSVQSQGRTLRNGIVNTVRFIRSDGVRKANIVVDPPALGRITVELTSSTSGVEASVKVASEQIRQIVQDQVTQLRDNLAQQGVQVSEFTVDVQQDNTGQGQDSGRENQRSPYSFDTAGNEDDTEDFRVDLEEGLLYWIA